MEKQEPKNSDGAEDSDVNALELNSDSKSNPTNQATAKPKQSLGVKVRGMITHLNIYLLLFVLIIILSGGIVFVGIQRSKKEASQTNINSSTLTKDALNKIKGTDAKVGDAKQTLNIESNAIFTGKVLVKNDLDVAGTIKIGGALNLPGITVTGISTFDQIQANKLSVGGDSLIQGQLTIHKNLTVSAGGSFGGPISAPSITVQTFNLVGDLQFNRHIDAGGSTPSISAYGGGLGSGGTASVSGTDTAGTITLNIGGSPPSGGCYVTINFAQKFNATPHIVVTPTSSGGASLTYYVTRNSTSFSLCSTSGVPSGSLTFDYVAMD